MTLKCPKCHSVAEYSGYPSDPKLSTVVCLSCGYAGQGATFPRHVTKVIVLNVHHHTYESAAEENDLYGIPWCM